MSMSKRNRIFLIVAALLIATSCFACARAAVSTEPERSPAAYASPSSPTATPLPTPEPTPSPVPTPFSIIWLSDTQTMAYHDYPGALTSMGEWIVEQKESRNILYVVQTGDAVDEGWVPKQWKNFDQLYDEFKDILPYFPIAGNHDVGIKWHGYEPYLERPYVKSIPPEQAFEGGRALYATFSAGGTDFLLLGAGWESETEASGWMNGVLREHPDHVAILLFHAYINADGTLTDVGELMFEQVVSPNPNVRLVLSGHVRGTGFRADDLDDTGDGLPDRRVNAMIYNYQHYDQNCGQLRVLTFDPLARSLEVTTYSPHSRYYFKDDYFKSEIFVIENAF